MREVDHNQVIIGCGPTGFTADSVCRRGISAPCRLCRIAPAVGDGAMAAYHAGTYIEKLGK
ncbi:MAG: hypothetical protein JRH15_20920 [Deltaproteobacteria bacterium]|nr:hypothetical protein [Deltaproteobacteria bacterium]